MDLVIHSIMGIHEWLASPACFIRNYHKIYTVLPRLVRRRTIKLMSFLIKKTIYFEQFLMIFVVF